MSTNNKPDQVMTLKPDPEDWGYVPSETVWLIECDIGASIPHIVWFAPYSRGHMTTEIEQALRFARREDAATMITWLGLRLPPRCQPVEHKWVEMPLPLDGDVVERADLAALDNILRYHETGGHEGDSSDHTLTLARKAYEGITATRSGDGELREQGQREGFAAAVQRLRDMGAQKPPPALWHAASLLADSLEQSRIPCAALSSRRGEQP